MKSAKNPEPTPARAADATSAAPASPARTGAGASDAAPLRELARAPLGSLSASKWRLGNGLTAVIMPDPSATSVSYTTWFRVGSRDEDEAAGQTGLAHLFEHLMFTQTRGQPVGAFDQAIEAMGGNSNAMTYYDFTAYLDSVPPGALARVAALEADRMLNLALDRGQVATERDVVIEERLGSVEDSVDGSLDELLYKQAFRKHPYRWPVIGWMKDIKAVTEAKAIAFYRRFYRPDNAVVVIAGKVDEAAALEVLVRSYGGLTAPAGAEPARAVAEPEHAPRREVRAALTRPVPADRLVIGYPAPGLAEADRAAYELANEMLLGGPSSRLYRRLVVQTEMASSARGDVPPTRDPGLYAIWIQMAKGHAAGEADALVREEIRALVRGSFTAAELDKAKIRLETAFWRELGSSHGKADLLGQFEIACGDFRRLFGRADEIHRVTAADVQGIANRYLSGPRSVVVASPPGASAAAPGKSSARSAGRARPAQARGQSRENRRS
ncbi:MAG TPA: pitrilysin family protein [Polyangia bacterium]|nr:pitrilysin family protein [Polyangia bacterium]